MGLPVSTAFDQTTGHPPATPTMIEGPCSTNVLTNSKGTARMGQDKNFMAMHMIPGTPPTFHQAPIATGSSTVFVNNMGVARITDSFGCGDMIAKGSGNVMAGG